MRRLSQRLHAAPSRVSLTPSHWRRSVARGRHHRRVETTSATAPATGPRDTDGKQRLVVLGSGWAGFKVLQSVDTTQYHVTMVSPRNYFLFTPLLPTTTVGTLEFRSIVEPVRRARKGLRYLQASAVSLDVDAQSLDCELVYDEQDEGEAVPHKPHFSVPYDRLVIAVGAKTQTFGIEGVERYCYFLKNLADARAIRQRIVECFERASAPSVSASEKSRLLTFVIVGGGPTSCEFAAELYDFCRRDVLRLYPELTKHIRVRIIEAGPQLLSTFSQALSSYATRLFRRRQHIDVMVNTHVKRVTRHHMHLSDGTALPFGLGVWSTGIAQIPFVESLPFDKQERSGRLIVDEFMRVPDTNSTIFAAGDCAVNAAVNLPPTAQAAQQEGVFIAKQLTLLARNQPLTEFHYRHAGMLAYIGGHKSLADTPHVKGKGFVSWLLWNGAYLTTLVSLKNKVIIPMQWLFATLFGRDITRF